MSKSVKVPDTIYSKALKKRSELTAKLGKTKKQLIQKEMEGVQSRPILSSHTKTIIKEKLGDMKPLHERLDEIADSKRKEIEFLAIKYEEQLYPINTGIYEKDKFDNWLNENHDWNNRKNFKLVEKKVIQDKQELDLVKRLSSKTAKLKLNQTFDDPNFESIYERYCMKPKKLKFEETSVKPFKSRKCPNFNGFSKSRTKDDKLVLDLTPHRELDITHFNTFRQNKSLKTGRKEVLLLSHRTTGKTKADSKGRNTFSIAAEEESRFSRWQDSIHFINTNRKSEGRDDIDALYKINVRNNLAWDNHREESMFYENNVVYTSKYKRILKNLFN
jgi:hypothetical protein